MKRIIAFVFLGIVIYAGIFIIFYGINEFSVDMEEPITLEMTLRDNVPVKDKISKQSGLLGKTTTQNKLFGIPIGKAAVTYFYIVPLGEHPDYLLFAVTDPEDIERIENASPGNEFTFTGIMKTLDPNVSFKLREYLMANPELIGMGSGYVLQTAAASHVAGYMVYVQDLKEPDAVPIIVGAAAVLVGAGLAALLTVRIVRERTGY